MLMVIFGAGASYDSSPHFPPPQPQSGQQNFGPPPTPSNPREAWRPPLTKDLFLDANGKFGAIVLTYPRLRGILPFLQQPQNGRSVEQQLELYQNEAPADEERTRQLLSVRYYLHDLFRMVSAEWLKQTNRVTNYSVLIEQIRHLNKTREPVCLVSFNYDLLLDDALLSFDYKEPQALENQFNAHPVFKLFKPHGSAHWARLVDFGLSPTTRLGPEQLIQQADNIQPTEKFVLANASSPNEMYNFEKPIVPAIAIPVQTKTEDTFEWPDSHRKYFEELLPLVTKILIIGWQGKEAHFLNLLREKLPKGGLTHITHLQVVGRDPAQVENISKQFLEDIDRRVRKLPALHAQGFSDFVRQELVRFVFED